MTVSDAQSAGQWLRDTNSNSKHKARSPFSLLARVGRISTIGLEIAKAKLSKSSIVRLEKGLGSKMDGAPTILH